MFADGVARLRRAPSRWPPPLGTDTGNDSTASRWADEACGDGGPRRQWKTDVVTKRGSRSRDRGRSGMRPLGKSTGRFAARSGTFNLAGELSTPEGARLSLVEEDVSEATAGELARPGARVAFEACGCGGGAPCKPFWPDARTVTVVSTTSVPQVSSRPSAPTWIDVWAGGGETVIFCYGDMTWGSMLP